MKALYHILKMSSLLSKATVGYNDSKGSISKENVRNMWHKPAVRVPKGELQGLADYS
jgi:hypothetical protein